MADAPEIAVAVPSHDRPVRLRWLLNALEEQTLDRSRFEIVIAHDSSGPETEALLRTHPLATDGTLRHVALPPGSAPPGRNRNAAWREARAPLLAFTDDDCRPPPDWLERALEAATANPGAIVQGATRPDPAEDDIGRFATHVTTRSIKPPAAQAQACNIVYPRSVLEEHAGFDEAMYVGEDTDLAERARAAGVELVGAPGAVTWHAVEEHSLLGMVRGSWRWGGLPELIRRHPRLRSEFHLWAFYRREHVWLPLVVAAWLLGRRNRLALALALPYVIQAAPRHRGTNLKGRLRAASELPGRFLIDGTEFLALALGSIRHRTFFL